MDIVQATPFLLTNPDFSKTEVVKVYAHTVVVPVIDYWQRTIEVKKGAQVERMKRVCIFNPLHVLDNKIWVSDVEGLKILKLSQHPQIMLQIEVMKTEVIKCRSRQVLTNSFNSWPPERLFRIFNSTFDADQSRSSAASDVYKRQLPVCSQRKSYSDRHRKLNWRF